MHPPFQHRFVPSEAVAAIVDYALPVHREYLAVLQTFPVVPGVPHVASDRVIMVMDHILGRDVTLALLRGNCPTVLTSAALVITSHAMYMPVIQRDLQLNLIANILKENAYVEKVAGEELNCYVLSALDRLALTNEFRAQVADTLTSKNNILVPWQLMEVFKPTHAVAV